MTGPEVVDVEVALGPPSRRDPLSVFLYHPNPDGKVEAETVAHANGAEYTFYPEGPVPPQGTGYVEINASGLYVSVGHLWIISPLTVKREEVAGIERAVVYITDTPFDPADTTEKTWLAVHLPLVHSNEENA